MFIDKITVSREVIQTVLTEARMIDDPPEGLAALLSWEEADEQVTMVMCWDTPAHRGEFAAQRMMPLFERGVLGEEAGDPDRVVPVEVYIRD